MAKKDVMAKNNVKNQESFGELARSLAVAVVLAMVFRSLFFEPFYIPSGSMKGTLLIGDYVFVSKYSYGYSRYSFPFGIEFFDGRKFEKEPPKRGDIVVFKLPSDTSINYIKRIIGLPGDKIQVKDSILYVNGVSVPRTRVEDFVDKDEEGNSTVIPQYIETLPNGAKINVLDQLKDGALDNTLVYEVPPHSYFMMGDNRDNSQDSRVLSKVGYVPEENILGPARVIFFSSSTSLIKVWKWFSSFRTERFFKKISPLETTND